MATVGQDAKSAREEYLKKYLSASDADKKNKKSKKKKQKSNNARGMKIVVDDAFIAVAPESSNIPSDEDEREDLRREIEEETKLAEIKPKFKKGTFQSIDDSEVTSSPGTSKYHSTRHDSDDSLSPLRCNDDDLSPERGQSKRTNGNSSPELKPKRNVDSNEDLSHKRARVRADSDDGLLAKKHGGGRRDSNDDLSPRRKKSSKSRRNDSDDDHSPKRARRDRVDSADDHASRTLKKRMDSDSDLSPRRIPKNGVDSDSDLSPPRSRFLDSRISPRRQSRYCGGSRNDAAPSTRSRNLDGDKSPRRESRYRDNSVSEISPRRRRSKHTFDSDGDLSPRSVRDNDRSAVVKRTHDSRRSRRNDDDSDASPQRRRHRKDDASDDNCRMGRSNLQRSSAQKRSEQDAQLTGSQKLIENNNSDTDLSPPRRQKQDSSGDLQRKQDRSDARDSDSGEHRHRSDGLSKTLDGKKAGLQKAEDLRDEMKQLKERENKLFENLDKDVSGRDAEVIRRSKMTGKGRETREDREKKEREAKKQEELNEKYKQWNKGVAQIKNRAEKLEEMARVVDEGFTRHADNEAMNVHMKGILLAEDPMLEYVQKKRFKKEIKTGLVYPTYKGGWPPNRFSIPPGYRWDGVDRSNGFEAQIAKASNRKVANEREYYENISKYE